MQGLVFRRAVMGPVSKYGSAWILAGITALTIGVYWNVPGFDFVGIDDAGYVTANDHVMGGISLSNLAWAFTATAQSNWQPLTWLSLMVDGSLGGSARIFHTTNIVLHVVNAWLLFLLLSRTTGCTWRPAFVATVFAVHPLHVESVAWVSERKDMLGGLFLGLILLAYASYARRPAASRYALCWILLVLGLMAKPILVSVPLMLVLLDLWPLRRLTDDAGRWLSSQQLTRILLWEKLPFVVPVLLSGAVTLYVQSSGGAVSDVGQVPVAARLANAIVSYARYLLKTFAPVGLAIPYPYDVELLTAVNVAGASIVIAGVTVAAAALIRRRAWLAAGWGWFLVTLLPVIGLVQVGTHSIADRYTYLSMTGLLVVVAWGAADVMRSKAVLPALIVIAVLAAAARVQTGRWRDTTTLFTHTLEVTGDNHVAHEGLGLARLGAGDLDGALHHFEHAVRVAPWNESSRVNLGAALIRADRTDEALVHYAEVLRRDPRHPTALANTGLAHFIRGDMAQAAMWIQRAIAVSPESAVSRKRLALALVALGDDARAIEQFEAAVRLDPADARIRGEMEQTRRRLGLDRP